MIKDSYVNKCNFYSRALEYTSNLYQIIYFLGIFVPIILGFISLGFYFEGNVLSIIILCFSILPFMVLGNIPKIQKYRELSKKYHILSMGFQNNYSNKLTIKYDELCNELSRNDINFLVKFFMKE